jgi:hypothetical protein
MSVRRLLRCGVCSGPPAAAFFLPVEPHCNTLPPSCLIRSPWSAARVATGCSLETFKTAPATLRQRGYPWDIHQPLARTTSAVSLWLERSMVERQLLPPLPTQVELDVQPPRSLFHPNSSDLPSPYHIVTSRTHRKIIGGKHSSHDI